MSGRVLLTGAAGLLGGEIAARLVARGFTVTALVHRARDVVGNDGAPVLARPIAGDVQREGFGWDAAARREAGAHDLLIHCAAVTAFDADPALMRAVNVAGTRHALAVARAGGMGFLYVGTAYVNGARDGRVGEDELAADGFTNLYEATKAEAERAVRGSGGRWAVARPSIVVGDAATGAIRRFDTFYLLLKMFAEGRINTMPARAGATLDLVPIDHVAEGVADLAGCFERAVGGTYHLVAGAPTPVAAFPPMLGRYPGLAAPRLLAPEAFAPERLPAAERRWYARVGAPYAPYFARDPRFDDTRFRALTGRAPPPVGPAWWARLIEYAVAAGFVAPAGVRRAPAASPAA